MPSCVNTEARGVGGARRQFSSCFDYTADLKMEASKLLKLELFCFLLDFQNFFQEEGEGGGKQGVREKP